MDIIYYSLFYISVIFTLIPRSLSNMNNNKSTTLLNPEPRVELLGI